MVELAQAYWFESSTPYKAYNRRLKMEKGHNLAVKSRQSPMTGLYMLYKGLPKLVDGKLLSHFETSNL